MKAFMVYERQRSWKTSEQDVKSFEQKYSRAFQLPIPRWVSFLHLWNPSLLVLVYKNLRVPLRLLFQVTGQSEDANSMFRHYIPRQNVPIFDVSRAMLELTRRRKAVLRDLAEDKGSIYRRLSSSSFSIPTQQLQNLYQEYTKYELEKFVDISVVPSAKYKVQRSYTCTGQGLAQT